MQDRSADLIQLGERPDRYITVGARKQSFGVWPFVCFAFDTESVAVQCGELRSVVIIPARV